MRLLRTPKRQAKHLEVLAVLHKVFPQNKLARFRLAARGDTVQWTGVVARKVKRVMCEELGLAQKPAANPEEVPQGPWRQYLAIDGPTSLPQ